MKFYLRMNEDELIILKRPEVGGNTKVDVYGWTEEFKFQGKPYQRIYARYEGKTISSTDISKLEEVLVNEWRHHQVQQRAK